MIEDNQKQYNEVRALLDAIITACSYLFAWYIKFKSPFANLNANIGVLPFETYLYAMWFLIPGFVMMYYAFRLYTLRQNVSMWSELYAIIKANVAGVAIFIIVLYIINESNFSRSMLFLFGATNICATTVVHHWIRKLAGYLRKQGYNVRYVLVVGYSRTAEEYINRIQKNPQWGYEIRGILDDSVPAGTMYKGVKVLGRIENLPVILPISKLDEIAITIALKDYERLERIVDLCEKSGVHTKFIPDYMSIIPTKPYTEDIDGLPAINIRYVPLSSTWNRMIKRLGDIVFAVLGIVISSPIMLVSAILVKTTSKGPIIFKQERVGLHNKTFQMYKFRSMRMQTVEDEKLGWTTKNDDRVTKVGRILRKTSLDELPQLFNILKGEMSLIGPRPERPQFVEQFKEEIPRYMVKHQVRPGLTGWAQVNGYRGDTSIYRRVEYDLYYIENWSIAFDMKIIFLTFFVGFVNKNAY